MDQEKTKRFQKLRWAAAPSLSFAALLSLFLIAFFGQSPPLERLKTEYPVVIWKGEKELFEIEFKKSKPPHWVRISEISTFAIEAVLLSEDSAFYQHHGIDFKQLKIAIQEALEEGGRIRGASTITQQVIKNVFLKKEVKIIRKIRELILAPKLEKIIGKQKILETYFNIAEWGPNGIFGIQKASYFYFQKHPSELTPKESAFLAMLLPNPRKYSISYRQKNLTPFAKQQIKRNLQKMLKIGLISQEQYDVEIDTPLSFEQKNPNSD